MNTTKFSVLISVYKNDKPEDFRTAVESISIHQTVKPSEIVIIVDGPVPAELEQTIKELEKEIPYIRVEWCKVNQGLGLALQKGMLLCSNEIVARMDADDISLPYRFEHQLRQFEEDQELSVAGGHITEFIDSPDNIVSSRRVPIGDQNIRNYMKKRDGLNHMTVMFKKSEVIKAGNYQDWFWNEDSYLWLRMYVAGCKFGNLDEVLVNVRVGREMYARRGGWKYFKSEAGLQKLRLKNHIIGLPRYCMNLTIHFIVKILMPNKVRAFIFQKLFRK